MKPSDLLHARIEEFLLAPMQELGFSYSKSQRTFRRKVGDFSQVIYLQPSSHNYENNCWFTLGFHVEAREYGRWYEQTWGEPVPTVTIWASSYWDIPDWPRKPKKALFGLVTRKGKGVPLEFHLTNGDEDEAQLEVLREALEGPALSQFEKVTSWEGAAEDIWKRTLHQLPKACDLFMIAGNADKARDVIDDGVRQAKKANVRETPQIVADLEKRRERFFQAN